jgi:hypothetical protein
MITKWLSLATVLGALVSGCGRPPAAVTDDGESESESETSTTGSPMVTTNDDANPTTDVASESADDTATGGPTTSEGTTSEGTTSEGTTSEGTTSEGTTSEGATSEGTTSEGTTSEGATTEGTTGELDCASIEDLITCNTTVGCIWMGSPMAGSCQAL